MAHRLRATVCVVSVHGIRRPLCAAATGGDEEVNALNLLAVTEPFSAEKFTKLYHTENGVSGMSVTER